MALVIENGTGVTGADSFITSAQLDTYATNYFGGNAHDGPTTKEPALRRTFLYLKSLSWKAEYTFPTFGGTIPEDIKLAQAILAYWETFTPNMLHPNVTLGQVKTLIRAGDISWQAMGQTGVEAQRATITLAEDLLKPYVNASGATRFLDRA